MKYYQRRENVLEEIKRTEEVEEEPDMHIYTGVSCLIEWRRKVWNIMENPETSIIAKVSSRVYF